MAEILRTRTTDEWIEWCKEHRVAYSPVASLQELLKELPVVEHPQGGQYRRLPMPIKFSATPGTVRREAPLPGAHNVEILTEAGYSAEEISALHAAGALVAEADLKPR
jgi:crotonobetainyl-CoA:carnitine CoA-transferase CaiB-like acyl-CoA transferase